MEVGRVSTADFSVPTDQHMSRRHLVLEGDAEGFRVRDVGSANGTYVNEARINAVELCNGDQIRAGVTTLAVSLLEDDQNPHAKDGVSFQHAKTVQEDLPAPVRTFESTDFGLIDDDQSTRHCLPPDELRQILAKARKMDSGLLAHAGDPTNSPWHEFNFAETDVPGLLRQPDASMDSRLTNLLIWLQPKYKITALVDFEKLDKLGKQHIGLLIRDGLVTWLTATVCKVCDNEGRSFRKLAELALTRDAFILLAARHELEDNALSELAEVASCPSQLLELVCKPATERKDRIANLADVIVFECDGSGRLCLFTQASAGPTR